MTEETNKSNFITVLSWILIVLSGMGLLMSIMQNIVINFMFETPMPKSFSGETGIAGFISSNLNLFILIMAVLILISLISAIGLLKRKNWARIIYTGLFGLGIIYMVATIITQWTVMNNVVEHSPKDDFGNAFYLVRIFMTIFLIGLSVLFGWLILKLNTNKIKKEFITV